MKTENQIKIEILKQKLESEIKQFEKEYLKRENLIKEIQIYLLNQKDRDAELEDLLKEVEELKNDIQNFSQEIYEMYMKYHTAKEEYEDALKGRREINERFKKQQECLDITESNIADYKVSIKNIEACLDKALAEEDANVSC